MKLYKLLVGLIVCVLLFSVGSVTHADDPPKSTESFQVLVTPPPPPAKGSFEPVSLQPATQVLDPSKASVTFIQPAAEDKSATTSALTVPNPYVGIGSPK